MKIFVDDIRFVPEQYDLFFRSAESFLKYLNENPNITIDKLSLDHDLGLGKIDGTELVGILINNYPNLKIKNIQLHTSNPSGWKNMYSKLKSAQKVKVNHFGNTKINEYVISCVDGRETQLYKLS